MQNICLVSDSILNQNQYYNFNMSKTLEKFELYTFASQQEKINHWMKWNGKEYDQQKRNYK